MNSYDTYSKTPNGVNFTETDVQKTAKKTTYNQVLVSKATQVKISIKKEKDLGTNS